MPVINITFPGRNQVAEFCTSFSTFILYNSNSGDGSGRISGGVPFPVLPEE